MSSTVASKTIMVESFSQLERLDAFDKIGALHGTLGSRYSTCFLCPCVADQNSTVEFYVTCTGNVDKCQ